jgi:hypothetical protein
MIVCDVNGKVSENDLHYSLHKMILNTAQNDVKSQLLRNETCSSGRK